MGTPSQRGSAFVRGQQSCHGDRRAPSPPPRGVATGTNQEPGAKMDAHCSVLAERREVRSLTGPRLKKVPRLNLNTMQRARPPRPQNSVPSKLLTFYVGIFKMHLRETGQILLA